MKRMLWLATVCASQILAVDWGAFDAVAERGLKEYGVPGAAVGVIEDGKVVFAKGYGLRDVKAGLPVTSRTLFGMGSVTKSFTSAVVASLVDEGKLAWDKPVREYLPWFRMFRSGGHGTHHAARSVDPPLRTPTP